MNYTESQLLMCEKEDLIEYIKYLRTITPEEEGEMLKHAWDVEALLQLAHALLS